MRSLALAVVLLAGCSLSFAEMVRPDLDHAIDAAVAVHDLAVKIAPLDGALAAEQVKAEARAAKEHYDFCLTRTRDYCGDPPTVEQFMRHYRNLTQGWSHTLDGLIYLNDGIVRGEALARGAKTRPAAWGDVCDQINEGVSMIRVGLERAEVRPPEELARVSCEGGE